MGVDPACAAITSDDSDYVWCAARSGTSVDGPTGGNLSSDCVEVLLGESTLPGLSSSTVGLGCGQFGRDSLGVVVTRFSAA